MRSGCAVPDAGEPKVLSEGVLEIPVVYTTQLASAVLFVVMRWPPASKPVETLSGAMDVAVVKLLLKAAPTFPTTSR